MYTGIRTIIFMSGNRFFSLALLSQYINHVTEHAALCSASVVFLGESCRYGLVSVLVLLCKKCHSIFRCYTSNKLTYSSNTHYTSNVQAVLGQIATGGGAEHLEEQLAYVQVLALTKVSFILLECTLGRVFE